MTDEPEKVYVRNIQTGSIDVPVRRELVHQINVMLLEGKATKALIDGGIALDYRDGDIHGEEMRWTVEIRLTNRVKIHAAKVEPL